MTKTFASALILSASMLGAAAVQAQEIGYPADVDHTASVTREQVRAELRDAIAQGSIPAGELDVAALTPSGDSTHSRAQVRAELRQAQSHGLESRGELDYPPVAG
ncbi:putative exported protein [plant metagenome]|uniref:Putative exported protein n=1 Tax=plant metagenome TaxID=1297885 RepID=A0A484QL22_9ZZZZ